MSLFLHCNLFYKTAVPPASFLRYLTFILCKTLALSDLFKQKCLFTASAL